MAKDVKRVELPAVVQEALRIRDLEAQRGPAYRCHTKSPYSDGYGDEGYGDYEDVV
jgi:hypothetical protein